MTTQMLQFKKELISNLNKGNRVLIRPFSFQNIFLWELDRVIGIYEFNIELFYKPDNVFNLEIYEILPLNIETLKLLNTTKEFDYEKNSNFSRNCCTF